MEHQNWDYTVIQGKSAGTQGKGEKALSKAVKEGTDVETIKKSTATNKHTGPSNIHNILEAEEYKVDTVSYELKVAIQKARVEKKLTQEKLALLINEKQSVIQDYESGRAIPSAGVINKLEKALGVKLPRPKKQKAKDDSQLQKKSLKGYIHDYL